MEPCQDPSTRICKQDGNISVTTVGLCNSSSELIQTLWYLLIFTSRGPYVLLTMKAILCLSEKGNSRTASLPALALDDSRLAGGSIYDAGAVVNESIIFYARNDSALPTNDCLSWMHVAHYFANISCICVDTRSKQRHIWIRPASTGHEHRTACGHQIHRERW